MKLSTVIITWNAAKYVNRCFDSLFAATESVDSEIIVVDNGSTDDTLSLIEKYCSRGNVQIERLDRNTGVAHARNVGIRKCKGDYVWILDIDTEVNKVALDAMLEYMDSNPACGLCGCKLINADGEVQESCRKFPSLKYKFLNVLSTFASNLSLKKLEKQVALANEKQFYHSLVSGTEPFEVEYVIGACQVVRREMFERVGMLDDNIFYGPEDADFCLRIAQAGYKVVYLPSVSILHDYQRMTNKKLFSRMSLLHLKALCDYWWKH